MSKKSKKIKKYPKLPSFFSLKTFLLSTAGVGFIAILAIVVLIQSKADDASQTVTVGNATPTVDTVTTAIASGGADQTSITLTEGSTKTIYIYGTATDNNGCTDINTASNWTVKAYITNHSSGSSCTADNNDCYAGASPTLTGCTGAGDLGLSYESTVSLQYYANPTDTGSPNAATTWTSYVSAGDGTANGTSSDTWEMNSLIALDVTASVSYGTISLGADSSQKTITFTNTGNRAIDADQSASGNFDCPANYSDITISQAELSTTNGFTYGGASSQDLATTTTNFDLTLAARTNDAAASTKDAYLILRIPTTGVAGSCTNTLTFSAKADA